MDGSSGRRPQREGRAPPLDVDSLPALAVRYLERYQTSRSRLIRYLERALRARGWAGDPPPDPVAVADAMVARGFVDDEAFAGARARSLARRGYGPGRVRSALVAAGIDPETGEAALADMDSLGAAIAFARRRRLGPFGPQPLDREARERQIGKLVRAGHSPRLARAIVAAEREADLPAPAEG